MVNESIKRRGLWSGLANIKNQKQWIKAIEKLGFEVISGKGSHCNAWRPGFDLFDPKGFVVTIQYHIRKDVSEGIFKELMKKGAKEDDIWVALGML